MKKSNRMGYKGESFKILKEFCTRFGVDMHRAFGDWLDLIILSHLSLTDNIGRGNMNLQAFDGKYDERYREILSKYEDAKEAGEMLSSAYAKLLKEVLEDISKDPLGELYMREITMGERGQYFTPEHITEMMGLMSGDGKNVLDPACGSGRMLISSFTHKKDGYFTGIDLDSRCAKMCVINFIMREMTGRVMHGNGLTNEVFSAWEVKNGFPYEVSIT